MVDRTKLEAVANKGQQSVGEAWDWVSRLVRANPKTGIFVCLVLGVLLDHFVISLVW